MKLISPIPIFKLSYSASKLLKSSHHRFSFFTTITSSGQNNPNGKCQREEETCSGGPVSVFWDFENCNLPSSVSASTVSQLISNAIRAIGINGPLQITGFGDISQIRRTKQKDLSNTGIKLHHVPACGKNSADRSLIDNLMSWVSENPPPAHILLISGDGDFAKTFLHLRMKSYNIFLACNDNASVELFSAATIVWRWSSLLKGDLSASLVNPPPDGPYSSWYRNHRGSLKDPFASDSNAKQCSSSQAYLKRTNESCQASKSNVKAVKKKKKCGIQLAATGCKTLLTQVQGKNL